MKATGGLETDQLMLDKLERASVFEFNPKGPEPLLLGPFRDKFLDFGADSKLTPPQ